MTDRRTALAAAATLTGTVLAGCLDEFGGVGDGGSRGDGGDPSDEGNDGDATGDTAVSEPDLESILYAIPPEAHGWAEHSVSIDGATGSRELERDSTQQLVITVHGEGVPDEVAGALDDHYARYSAVGERHDTHFVEYREAGGADDVVADLDDIGDEAVRLEHAPTEELGVGLGQVIFRVDDVVVSVVHGNAEFPQAAGALVVATEYARDLFEQWPVASADE